ARGVATGQAAVLYDGDRVLGSGTISAATGGQLASPVRPGTAA
ncbi:MAG: tRNA 2-thiouridine(34) synthase MnmA, partial [Actinobacteria bacterium]|nr:tRNA 2-thiouridine(34) synthase MnmA [Actinomycetota bacterium]